MTFRHLTKEEIKKLLSNNCIAGNWENISVKEGFSADNIINTRFSGNIILGIMPSLKDDDKDISRAYGIHNSHICNCEIGDNVHISDVRDLTGYKIGNNVIIRNVSTLSVKGESTFGNGVEIEVLNEGGGRELPIFEKLSSQIAYLSVIYRHDKEFISGIFNLIKEFCESKRSAKGIIGDHVRIEDSLTVQNVNIGSCAVINGAALLEDGTIQSCKDAPAYIGMGVNARKFIILSGSVVEGGAIIEKSFIGQGVKMGKQFSSENSAFFANCEAFHGEACSLFAGPYAVTHHKSTLMIASLVSFFNAGSGTNQSNHMYKLGPLHQGILERGSKTGSFSYLLLPVHIGAFSVVVGKHYSNFDTSDFPFSYISEEKGRSELTPAMNLFTVGTRRDCDKWPARDRRKDPEKLDLIHFELFNPFTIGKVINGINILNELEEKTDRKQDYVSYKGISIRRLLLKTTRKYYETALNVYIGQEIVKRLRSLAPASSKEDLQALLSERGIEGTGKWADVCGMLSPVSKINDLIDSVKNHLIKSIEDLQEAIKSIHASYDDLAWVWCASLVTKLKGQRPADMAVDGLIQILSDWKTNAVKLNNMILKDAEKEFDAGSRIGFGVDGDQTVRDKDFIAVRGEYDKNKFITGLRKEITEIEETAEKLTTILRNIG